MAGRFDDTKVRRTMMMFHHDRGRPVPFSLVPLPFNEPCRQNLSIADSPPGVLLHGCNDFDVRQCADRPQSNMSSVAPCAPVNPPEARQLHLSANIYIPHHPSIHPHPSTPIHPSIYLSIHPSSLPPPSH
ncbi:hypothetical protein K504DRAFT_204866 [Pleomassaria siparia CBS 279.74]|uniref:Uncharacterized protein n=1 Tax=Pleomassaria siparia CBS 279.74 TaxID=1314801 RepID=A0A6G1KJ13_9PLEO|nr:hypothetical protein K504DRAFT_204866 [Pleomassaria siparia CBS 279.74]